MSSYLKQLNNTIFGRILFYVVIPTIGIFLLIMLLAMSSGFRASRQSAEQYLDLLAKWVASDIEEKNMRAVMTAERMAQAQMAGMFGDRLASLDYARRVLESSPEFTGAYFGYEPNADQQDANPPEGLPATSMDNTGRFIPYWFVSQDATSQGQRRSIELEACVNLDTSLYYQGAKDQFLKTKQAAPLITEPYVYQGKMIVEQVYPIVKDGKFVGIAGIDFALADVETVLRSWGKRENVDLFLVSSRGRFIASTTDPTEVELDSENLFKTKAVAETPYAEPFHDLISANSISSLRVDEDPIDGETYYFSSSRLPISNWTLILRESEAAILAPIWSNLLSRLAIGLSGLGVIVAILLLMAYRLGRRIQRAVMAAEQVAEGILTTEIEVDSTHDETGRLLVSLDKMTKNLNKLVGNTKQATVQLNSTATELAATSRQQETAANSFGASTNEIAAASKQISATTYELVDTMKEVHDVALGTAELASSGRTELQTMETNMRGLDRATASIGEKLAVINEKASDITGIVTTITKVADQTNLLSVNAAIEAEKAGEYGIGFLVVAREIRRLADQTATATLNIEQMVQQMHSAVSTGVMEMDHFTEQVRNSVSDVVKISAQMGDIIERVAVNTSRFERVHESMLSQSQGAEQISESMADLTNTAMQTMEAATEYSRAAEDLREAITSLQQSVATFQLGS